MRRQHAGRAQKNRHAGAGRHDGFFHPARCQLWMYLANPSLKSRLVW